MKTSGLVLEGGGLRGVFSSGILDYMLEKNIDFPYVIGVSMGALNASSYISKQAGRSFRVPLNHINNPRYLSLWNLLKDGSLFGMDFIFNKIVYELDPFNFDSFEQSNQKFVIVAADCIEGKASYFEKGDLDRKQLIKALMASSSLPYISKMIEIDKKQYLDGGIIDAIPIEKALEDNIQKPVIILTRPYGYRKKDSGILLSKLLYKNFPQLKEMIKNKASNYNRQIELIEKLEKENKVFVIRPDKAIQMGRTEKNKKKLTDAYNYGYETMKKEEIRLKEWLKS